MPKTVSSILFLYNYRFICFYMILFLLDLGVFMKNTILFFTLLFIYTIYTLDVYTVVAWFSGGIPLSEKNHLKNLSPALIALFFTLIFLSSLLKEKYFKIFMYIISVPISILNMVIIWYLLYYNTLIDFEIMNTIMNTNMQETKEFFSVVFDYKMVLAFISVLFPFVLVYFMKPYKISNKIILSVLCLTVIVIIVLTHNQRWVKREIAAAKIYNTYIVTSQHRKEFQKILLNADKAAMQFDNISSLLTNNKQTFVFVISESQNKIHFSLYGYDKNTTPFLDSIKDELYVFNNVDSPHVYTNISMEKMITFSDNYNKLKGYEAGDLIRFFQDAGFKTYWFSNQYFLGPHESLYSAIAFRADKTVFLNKISSQFLETANSDGALIKPFKEALNENVEKKFIVLHFMGSHAPFEARYPKGFGSFDYRLGIADLTGGISKQKDIATYDNSIEYTDYVLKEIISLLKNDNSESFLLFLSDHGTDVYDTFPDKILPRSHSFLVPALVEIPFFIWFSDKYKQNYKNVVNRTANSLNNPYQADRVPHTILDLARLSHDLYVDNDSIISDNFTIKERFIGEKSLDKGWEYRK